MMDDPSSSMRRSHRAAHQASSAPSAPETLWGQAPNVATTGEPFTSFFPRGDSNPFFLPSASSSSAYSSSSSSSAFEQNASSSSTSSSSVHPTLFPFSSCSSSVRSNAGVNPFSNSSQHSMPSSRCALGRNSCGVSCASVPLSSTVPSSTSQPPPHGSQVSAFDGDKNRGAHDTSRLPAARWGEGVVDHDEDDQDDVEARGAGVSGHSPLLSSFMEYLPSSFSPSSSHRFRHRQEEPESAAASAAASFLSSSQRTRTRLPRCLHEADSDAEGGDEGEDDDVVLPTSISSIPAECADLRELRQVLSRIERDDLVKRQQLRKQFTLLQKQESLLLEQERQLMKRDEELQKLHRQVGQLRAEAKDHIATAEEARRAWSRASAALSDFKDKVRDGAEVKSLLREALSQADRELDELRQRVCTLERDRGSNSTSRAGDQSEKWKGERQGAKIAAFSDEDRARQENEGEEVERAEDDCTENDKEKEFSKALMWILKLLGEDEYDENGELGGSAEEELFYASFHKQEQLKKILEKHPGIANHQDVVAALRQRLRREALQIQVYVQQRKAMKDAEGRTGDGSHSPSSSSAASSSSISRLAPSPEEGKEDEEERLWRDDGYERLKRQCLSRELLLLLFSSSCSETLQRMLHYSLEEGCQRWLDMLKDAVFCHFLRGHLHSYDILTSLLFQKKMTSLREKRNESDPQNTKEGKGRKHDGVVSQDARGAGVPEQSFAGKGREIEEEEEAERRAKGRQGEDIRRSSAVHEGSTRKPPEELPQGARKDQEKYRSSFSSSSKIFSSPSKDNLTQGEPNTALQGDNPDDCRSSESSPPISKLQQFSARSSCTPHPLLSLLKYGKGNWLQTARWLYYGIMPVGLFTPLQPSSSLSSLPYQWNGSENSSSSTTAGETRQFSEDSFSSFTDSSASALSSIPGGPHSLVDEEGNSVLHWAFKRNAPEIISRFRLLDLPCLSLAAKNKRGETPAELLPTLFDSVKDRAWREERDRRRQERGESGVSPEGHKRASPVVLEAHKNLKYWRGLVFDVATQASMLYRSHRSEAAYELYTEALTVQNRVLDAHKILQSLGHAPFSSSSVSVVENTAKLSFNKACECLLDWEGALSALNLLEQHCGTLSPSDRQRKQRYQAQVNATAFQILDVNRDATPAEVNRAFRKWSIRFHPDKSSHLSPDMQLRNENVFKKLNEARRALTNGNTLRVQRMLPSQTLYEHPSVILDRESRSSQDDDDPRSSENDSPNAASTSRPSTTGEKNTSSEPSYAGTSPPPSSSRTASSSTSSSSGKNASSWSSVADLTAEQIELQREGLLRSVRSLESQQSEILKELAEGSSRATDTTTDDFFDRPSTRYRMKELEKLKDQMQTKQTRLEVLTEALKRKLGSSSGASEQQRRKEGSPDEGDNDDEEEDDGGGRTTTRRSESCEPEVEKRNESQEKASEEEKEETRKELNKEEKENKEKRRNDSVETREVNEDGRRSAGGGMPSGVFLEPTTTATSSVSNVSKNDDRTALFSSVGKQEGLSSVPSEGKESDLFVGENEGIRGGLGSSSSTSAAGIHKRRATLHANSDEEDRFSFPSQVKGAPSPKREEASSETLKSSARRFGMNDDRRFPTEEQEKNIGRDENDEEEHLSQLSDSCPPQGTFKRRVLKSPRILSSSLSASRLVQQINEKSTAAFHRGQEMRFLIRGKKEDGQDVSLFFRKEEKVDSGPTGEIHGKTQFSSSKTSSEDEGDTQSEEERGSSFTEERHDLGEKAAPASNLTHSSESQTGKGIPLETPHEDSGGKKAASSSSMKVKHETPKKPPQVRCAPTTVYIDEEDDGSSKTAGGQEKGSNVRERSVHSRQASLTKTADEFVTQREEKKSQRTEGGAEDDDLSHSSPHVKSNHHKVDASFLSFQPSTRGTSAGGGTSNQTGLICKKSTACPKHVLSREKGQTESSDVSDSRSSSSSTTTTATSRGLISSSSSCNGGDARVTCSPTSPSPTSHVQGRSVAGRRVFASPDELLAFRQRESSKNAYQRVPQQRNKFVGLFAKGNERKVAGQVYKISFQRRREEKNHTGEEEGGRGGEKKEETESRLPFPPRPSTVCSSRRTSHPSRKRASFSLESSKNRADTNGGESKTDEHHVVDTRGGDAGVPTADGTLEEDKPSPTTFTYGAPGSRSGEGEQKKGLQKEQVADEATGNVEGENFKTTRSEEEKRLHPSGGTRALLRERKQHESEEDQKRISSPYQGKQVRGMTGKSREGMPGVFRQENLNLHGKQTEKTSLEQQGNLVNDPAAPLGNGRATQGGRREGHEPAAAPSVWPTGEEFLFRGMKKKTLSLHQEETDSSSDDEMLFDPDSDEESEKRGISIEQEGRRSTGSSRQGEGGGQTEDVEEEDFAENTYWKDVLHRRKRQAGRTISDGAVREEGKSPEGYNNPLFFSSVLLSPTGQHKKSLHLSSMFPDENEVTSQPDVRRKDETSLPRITKPSPLIPSGKGEKSEKDSSKLVSPTDAAAAQRRSPNEARPSTGLSSSCDTTGQILGDDTRLFCKADLSPSSIDSLLFSPSDVALKASTSLRPAKAKNEEKREPFSSKKYEGGDGENRSFLWDPTPSSRTKTPRESTFLDSPALSASTIPSRHSAGSVYLSKTRANDDEDIIKTMGFPTKERYEARLRMMAGGSEVKWGGDSSEFSSSFMTARGLGGQAKKEGECTREDVEPSPPLSCADVSLFSSKRPQEKAGGMPRRSFGGVEERRYYPSGLDEQGARWIYGETGRDMQQQSPAEEEQGGDSKQGSAA
ncbi:hypothetical protein CSUI_007618 [Cystoisospora suis]|uniref:J domain-containing protein n=1 Tax=Cystoisospora suis TaxID=483139 RepID=A0A2C6KPX6_9APIC|nr:hypothetical protein CSUI_007618 [Cystoisospora suis]